jgi:hypothetical protein
MMRATDFPSSRAAQARDAFAAGDIKTALRIVSRFNRELTRDEQHLFQDGYEAIVHPRFAWSVGNDPAVLVERACALFRVKFLKEE